MLKMVLLILLGVVVVLGVLLLLLFWHARTHVMDGPGMVYQGEDTPNAAMIDFRGKWMTEDGFPMLTIEDGSLKLIYRDELGKTQTLTVPAAVEEGRLVPGEGAEKLGFYSSIRKTGRFLYATDAFTGEEDVFAPDRVYFKAGTLNEYDGTWLDRGGRTKLVIKAGMVTRYRKDDKGNYKKEASGKADGPRNGVLYPARGDELYGLAGYYTIEKKGKLLYTSTPVMDGPAMEDVFALEGHEEDLPPVPVYVKKPEDVTDRRLAHLELSAHCFDDEKTEAFLFKSLPGLQEATSLKLTVAPSRLTGETWVAGTVSRSGSDAPLKQVHTPLTGELEEKLAAALLTEAVLKENPSRDTSDMACPTVYFTLKAKFASGEEISISTAYGVPIGDAALDLAALLLGEA